MILRDPVIVSGIVAAIISSLAGYLIQRTSAKASTTNASIASRTDIEREAFERAKGYYTDTIDRQQAEITELEADVSGLKAALKSFQSDLAACRQACRALAKAGRLPSPFDED